jgi:hypothetical protein
MLFDIKMNHNKEDNSFTPDYEREKEAGKVVFVPAEDIRVIEQVLNNWETVKQGWEKLNVDN